MPARHQCQSAAQAPVEQLLVLRADARGRCPGPDLSMKSRHNNDGECPERSRPQCENKAQREELAKYTGAVRERSAP